MMVLSLMSTSHLVTCSQDNETSDMDASEKTTGEEPGDFGVCISDLLKSMLGLLVRAYHALLTCEHFSVDLQCFKVQKLKIVISHLPFFFLGL